MRAKVDPEACIGCELCVQLCPEVFKMAADKAIAYTDPVPDQVSETCKQAVEQCPVTAISLE
jgi:ferredoxin